MSLPRLPDSVALLLVTVGAIALARTLDALTVFSTADWVLFLSLPAPYLFVARYARVRWSDSLAGRALMLKGTGTAAFLTLAVLSVVTDTDQAWWPWARFLVYGYLFAAQWYLTALLFRLQREPGHTARADTLTEGDTMTTTPATTQQAHPWRAALRTALQVAVGLGLVVPLALAAMDETLGDVLPPEVRAKVWAIGGGIIAVAAFLARIMAVPQVDRVLKRLGLSSSPEPTVPPVAGGGL